STVTILGERSTFHSPPALSYGESTPVREGRNYPRPAGEEPLCAKSPRKLREIQYTKAALFRLTQGPYSANIIVLLWPVPRRWYMRSGHSVLAIRLEKSPR